MNIEITGLSKIYPNGHAAIKGVSLEIGSGMFGLLGPNGAGKSSFMRILVTLQKATSGVIRMDGMDINEHRHEIRSQIGEDTYTSESSIVADKDVTFVEEISRYERPDAWMWM